MLTKLHHNLSLAGYYTTPYPAGRHHTSSAVLGTPVGCQRAEGHIILAYSDAVYWRPYYKVHHTILQYINTIVRPAIFIPQGMAPHKLLCCIVRPNQHQILPTLYRCPSALCYSIFIATSCPPCLTCHNLLRHVIL